MLQITCIYVTQLVGVDKYNWKAAMWTSGNKEKIELQRYKPNGMTQADKYR